MDLISVIVPVYGVEKELEKCVRSIQRQTYAHLDIILVDDGSPDRCGAICDELAAEDSRIRVIHKPNGGLSDARNAGIDAALGAFIAFVDSDDWIDPMMLEVLHRVCLQQEACIAECSFRNMDVGAIKEETRCSAEIRTATSIQAIESNLRWEWFKTVVWNKLYRRDVIGDIRFPKGKVHEDEFTTHRFYLAARRIAYVDISFYNYNKTRASSITGTFRLANLDAVEAYHEKANLAHQMPELAPIQVQMCNNYCYTFFDKLMHCVLAEKQGSRVEEVLSMFRSDMQWMRNLALEPHYFSLFDRLQTRGMEDCAREWEKLIGGGKA